MMGIVELMKAIVMIYFEVMKGIYLQQKYLIIIVLNLAQMFIIFFNQFLVSIIQILFHSQILKKIKLIKNNIFFNNTKSLLLKFYQLKNKQSFLFQIPLVSNIILFASKEMSRKRNRHRSLSNTSRDGQRSLPSTPKKELMGRSTTHSLFTPHSRNLNEADIILKHHDALYNKNIARFRETFNQNDVSQLPFMSSLREEPVFAEKGPKTVTVCFPFQAALKNTSNQQIKKRISDLSSKQTRLSGAYYRWHNNSGRNYKWGVQFQCSLRDYNLPNVSKQLQFYPYIKPIHYKDVQQQFYEQKDMVCPKHNKSFKIR